MTEQQIDRDRLRASAESALACGTFDGEVLSAVPQLLDQLEQAEAELDSWMARAYEAEGKLWKAEARIKAVRDVLDEPDAMIGTRLHVSVDRICRALDGA